MLSFLIGFGLGYVGYQTALVTVGYYLSKSNTAADLAAHMLRYIYCMISIVFSTWFIFGAAAEYLIMFAMAHAATMCAVDFENTIEANKDL